MSFDANGVDSAKDLRDMLLEVVSRIGFNPKWADNFKVSDVRRL